jgi:hypothetical protein
MIHKRPDFLAVVCFGSSPTPCLNSPVRKLERRHTGRLRKRDNVLKGEGEEGRGGAKSYDGEKAWSSIIHSILSAIDWQTPNPVVCIALTYIYWSVIGFVAKFYAAGYMPAHPGIQQSTPKNFICLFFTRACHATESDQCLNQLLLVNLARDGILGHQFNKRLEYFASYFSQSLLALWFHNPRNKKTRVFSWIAFCRTEKWG